ncbi:MAG: MFS transporter [Brevundimonas sp.]
MTTDTGAPVTKQRTVQAASFAVFAVFFLNGFNFATWASRLPAVRDGLEFSQAQMGLLLLVIAVGSLVALPLAGMVVERLGARRTVGAFALLNALGLILASTGVGLDTVPVTIVGLVVFGVGTGVWDAAMNLEGAAVEQKLGYTVMPRYHASFSFGTFAAAGIAAVVAGFGVPVWIHLPVAVVVTSVCVLVAIRSFLPSTDEHVVAPSPGTEPAATAPRGARGALAAWIEPRTLLIGLVVLAAALTEGSANDWVGLAVVDGWDAPDALAAVAFAVFVGTMTTARWFGTWVLDRYGRVAVLRTCSVLALAGLGIFALVGPLWLAMIGIVLWGAGASLGFPVGMSAASDDPVRAAARLSVVSTIGYSAFLAGPPLLGLLAHHIGYRHALLAVAIPTVLGLLVTGAAAPLRKTSTSAD